MSISGKIVQNMPNQSPSKSEAQQRSDLRVMTIPSVDSCCSFCRNRLQQVQKYIFLKYLWFSEKFIKFIFEKFRKFPFQKVYIKGVFSSNIVDPNVIYKSTTQQKIKSAAIKFNKPLSVFIENPSNSHGTWQKCLVTVV